MQRNLSLRPFGPPPSSEGGLGFRFYATLVKTSSEGGLGFRFYATPVKTSSEGGWRFPSLKGFSSAPSTEGFFLREGWGFDSSGPLRVVMANGRFPGKPHKKE